MDEKTNIPQVAKWMIEEMRKYIRLEVESLEGQPLTLSRITDMGIKMVNLSLAILEYYPSLAYDADGIPCPPDAV